MARVKRSRDLQSIEARRELKIRREPYFMVIEKGLALGYRRSRAGWRVVRPPIRSYDRSERGEPIGDCG